MFSKCITKTIAKVLKANGYKKDVLDKECIYFFKRYSSELAFYVKCRDARRNNHGILVEMFLAPIDIPDDRIEVLPAGIHIVILKVCADEFTDEIMIGAGEKIIKLEKKLAVFENMILNELKAPYFPNGRWEVVTQTHLIYNTLNNEPQLRERINEFMSCWCNCTKKNKPSVYDFVSELIDNMPKDFFDKIGIDYEKNIIKNRLSEYIRAHCLLDD